MIPSGVGDKTFEFIEGDEYERFEKFTRNNKSVKDSKHVHGFSDEFLKEKGEDKNNVFWEFIEFLKLIQDAYKTNK